jgi:serine/threonine protein phosphatase PrpC
MKHPVTTVLFPVAENSANMYVSVAEAMNPTKRPHMEDISIIHAAGEWPIPGKALENTAYLAVYDGHGGRDMVDFLEHSMSHHLAHELLVDDDTLPVQTRLERAFLLTDIHAQQSGISSSGSTVACCTVEVSRSCLDVIVDARPYFVRLIECNVSFSACRPHSFRLQPPTPATLE